MATEDRNGALHDENGRFTGDGGGGEKKATAKSESEKRTDAERIYNTHGEEDRGAVKSSQKKTKHSPFDKDQSWIVEDGVEETYTVPFDNPYRGSVSKVTAGQVYKANKNGDIEVLPETIRMLYDAADDRSSMGVKNQRYTSDSRFYDTLTNVTRALLNNDHDTAQRLINWIEYDNIKRAGKKSSYFKYRNQLELDDDDE